VRHLTASTNVDAPGAFVLAFLQTYFAERAAGVERGEACLSFPLNVVAGLKLERSVAVEVRYGRHEGANHSVDISWFTPGTSAFPRFSGSFATRPTVDSRCLLVLDGSYEAPGGPAGAAFDATIGHRIAEGSLDVLLRQLADAAQADYGARTF